jgi:hypothetical protein
LKKEELKIEWQLVLMGSVEIAESESVRFKELLEERFDWSEVIFQLITHRTLNLFYYNLKKYNLVDKLEKEVQRLMESQWSVYGERNSYYLQELSKIAKKFEENNVVVPVLKGNILASLVYPSIETRIFNDLDMLIQLSDVAPVTKALESEGFLQGHYDEEKNVIVEASRKEKMLQQVASHELQEFQKLGDSKFVKVVQADVNHDVLWSGNCPYKIPTSDLIKRAIKVEINGQSAYMLEYIDNIIQLSCHLFKEATLMMWVSDLRDLKIYKFADLYSYIRKFYKEINWNELIERVKGYGSEKIVYYNFHYIEMMFGELIPKNVLDALRPSDLSYLDEYGIENKEPSKWNCHFFTRLFDTNRVLEITEEQCENISRFIDAKVETNGVMNVGRANK